MSAKGKTIRPCYVCNEPVNFVLWEEETSKRKSRVSHWANPDGSHHYHKTVDSDEQQKAHMYEIVHGT